MLSELSLAARLLRARPLFTAVAVATLAIGIGANAAIFSVIHAVLLRPLPYPDSERLLAVYSRYLPSTGYDFPYFALSGPEFADIRARVDAFEGVAAFDLAFRNLADEGSAAERVLTMQVTAGFFDVLAVAPRSGRAFTEEEARAGRECLAVLAHDLAANLRLGVGSTIRLDDEPCAAIGVLPEGFFFRDERIKVWTALAIDAEDTPNNRASHPLLAIGRLRLGVSPEQTDAQLDSLRRYWSDRYPDHYAKGHFAVRRPLHEDLVGDQRQPLLLLVGAVAFVLLIVCVNLAALLLSRGETRRREFAVRHALGANRRRLVRQLLVESMLLATIGGGAGLLLANWLLAGLLALYPQRLPAAQAAAIDYRTLLLTTALVVASGLVVGVVPALGATGVRLQDALKSDTRGTTVTRRGARARSALVVGQLAMSIVLLTGAILLIRSYHRLQQVDLGVDHDRVLTFSVSIPQGRQPDPAAARRLLSAIEERLAALPDVETAAAVANLPLVSAGPPDDFVIEGRVAPPPGAPAWNARYVLATPGMFHALRIPLERGRLLSEGDVPGQPLVAVINRTAARLYWPGEDPVGRTIRYYPQDTSPSIRIVGIVGDVRSMGPDNPPPPAVYVPFAQAPRPAYEGRTMTFLVRADGNPHDVVPSARAAVAAVDPSLPLANVRSMSAVVAGATGQPRFTTIVMSVFAGLAFLLAALGLYSILAYGVEQRTREIGIRIALGADRREIFRLIVGGGMGLALAGVLFGIPAALALSRLLEGVLSGITTTDGVTYVAVISLLTISALAASYLPARRATRIDPVVALRAE